MRRERSESGCEEERRGRDTAWVREGGEKIAREGGREGWVGRWMGR